MRDGRIEADERNGMQRGPTEVGLT
jgi:hypothetical protein